MRNGGVDADQRSISRIAHHLFGGGTLDTKVLKPVAADKTQLGVAAKRITFPEVRSAFLAAPKHGLGKFWFVGNEREGYGTAVTILTVGR